MTNHKLLTNMEQALPHILDSPATTGTIELIVCRPKTGERKILSDCELTIEEGLVGDNWKQRGYSRSPDRSANVEMQLNLMNARSIAAITDNREHWPLAGDQFFVDFDLSKNNLPAGTRLQIGEAVIEVTAEPHLGCLKFSERFGKDAVKFVNSDSGKQLNLRGINAKVIVAGRVRSGDPISKLTVR